MSQVLGDGSLRASYWNGMATSVSSCLERMQHAPDERVAFPAGQFAAAERFFADVVEAQRIGRGAPFGPDIAASVRVLSNCSIALEAIRDMPVFDFLSEIGIEASMKRYLECVRAIKTTQSLEGLCPRTVASLRVFLRSLAGRGSADRESANPCHDGRLVLR